MSTSAIKDVTILPGEKNLTIRAESARKELPIYWERDYINDKINETKNNSQRMLLITLWYSGARISEIVGLRKKDIDFNNYVLNIQWLKSRKYKQRILPLHPNLRDMLRIYVATMNLEDKVFPITRQRAWQIVQERMGGHPHQFRHSFAVNWLRCGGDLVMLHKILGHSKIQTTMEYLKIVPTDQGKELLKITFS